MANKKILLIEDDELIMEMITIQLKANSFDVIGAGNGKDGITKAGLEMPDLILTDLVLPDMDGNELISSLKKDDTTKHIPIVVASGMDMHDQKALNAIRAGANGYISKPYKIEALLKLLEEHLN